MIYTECHNCVCICAECHGHGRYYKTVVVHYTCTQCFMLIEIVTVKREDKSLPGLGCDWLRVCNVAMTMITLDCMCVQNFMTTHMTNNNL